LKYAVFDFSDQAGLGSMAFFARAVLVMILSSEVLIR
jgi:hypothetical protein